MSTEQTCGFCKSWDPLVSGLLADTVLWSAEDIVVTPTLGSLLPGWVLVVPGEHALSAAKLSAVRRGDLERAVDHARRVTERIYGTATVFEHGPCFPGSATGCTTDHAHIHVVPLTFDIISAAKSTPVGSTLDWKKHASWTEVWDAHQDVDYIAASAWDGIWAASGEIGSQFFRRIIADAVGTPDRYDWRSHSGEINILETIQMWLGDVECSGDNRTYADAATGG